MIRAAFDEDQLNATTFLHVYVQLLYASTYNGTDSLANTTGAVSYNENITSVRVFGLADEAALDSVPESNKKFVFEISDLAYDKVHNRNAILRVRFRTNNTETAVPLQFAYDPSPLDKSAGVIYAGLLLLGLYGMIIWDVVHRTFAAMIASTMAIAILAAMNERPTMPEIMSWIDVETLLLLFGMMILVAILSETGIFDYLAVYAYKVRVVMDAENIVGISDRYMNIISDYRR